MRRPAAMAATRGRLRGRCRAVLARCRRSRALQWTRQNEHSWEPLGAAMSHDLAGVVDETGITAWFHRIYALTANNRPTRSAPGSLLPGELLGNPPAALPGNATRRPERARHIRVPAPARRGQARQELRHHHQWQARNAARAPVPAHDRSALARWPLELVRERVVLRRARA